MMEIDIALEFAKELSIAAGALAQEQLRSAKTLKVDEKRLGDIVSSADINVEAMLRNAISQRFPEHAFLGEESGGSFDGLTWIIDPIDGTWNFVREAPFWCVSIALFDGNRPVLGVVRDPNLGETFAAIAGRGATCNGRPIATEQREILDGATICFGFTKKRPISLTLDVLTRLASAGASLRAGGRSALTLSPGSRSARWLF